MKNTTKGRKGNSKRLHREETINVETFCEVFDELNSGNKLSGLSGTQAWDIIKKEVIQDGVAVRYPKPKRQAFGDLSMTETRFSHHYLALTPELTGEVLKVFHYACSILEFSNWCYLYPTVIAENMGLRRQNVTRSLSILEKKGLLIRGEKQGRHYRWRLNPEVAWMGNNQERWDLVTNDGVPYSDFVEKRLAWGEDNGYDFKYLRYLKDVTQGDEIPDIALTNEEKAQKKAQKNKEYRENCNKQREYDRELRIKLLGEEYADGINWNALSDEEAARLHIRYAQVKLEMEESGEWEALKNKYFPPEERPKAQVIDFKAKRERQQKAVQLAEKFLESDIDLDALDEFLKARKKNGTK